VAYVRSKRVFSIASRFSIPISQAIPCGQPELITKRRKGSPNGSAGEGANVSLRMGMRAFGNGLTYPSVSPQKITLRTYVEIRFLH